MLKIAAALIFLSSSVAMASTPQNPGSAPEAEKVTCKKRMETGSWVKGRRVCHTASEWRELAQNAQDTLEQTRGLIGFNPCGEGASPAQLGEGCGSLSGMSSPNC